MHWQKPVATIAEGCAVFTDLIPLNELKGIDATLRECSHQYNTSATYKEMVLYAVPMPATAYNEEGEIKLLSSLVPCSMPKQMRTVYNAANTHVKCSSAKCAYAPLQWSDLS